MSKKDKGGERYREREHIDITSLNLMAMTGGPHVHMIEMLGTAGKCVPTVCAL